MHAVVNTLTFAEDVDPSTFATADEVIGQMQAVAGFIALHVVQTGPRQVTLVILGDSAETLDRLATEVGSPWMMANIVPLLAGPPDRKVGPVLASG